ncbi:uncharacterized protein LOC126744994 [Anthonomus grandis grandis]|uniref:uncharacterized protein LOC126744994 n=1 Tax=Anthonomus grandis grandis TaxID=2921223 RepID=UPI002166585F|nr:uncharacterized protein LOC126744994 [Anthonomus grandis grandis]
MSSSTIAVNEGLYGREDSVFKSSTPKFEEPKPSVLYLTSLWLFQSIFSACKMEFSSNIQGVTVSFNIQDVVLIAFAAWMLHRGLSTRNIALIFPWVIVTLYGLYFNQYRSIKRMMSILKAVRNSTGLPWMALIIISVGLGLRVILILRTLQASANLWYRRKLEKELYETLN